jgi:hypothetical protein
MARKTRLPDPAVEEEGSYEVGYGKPPKHTQFKPGQSGNRHGRPPGTRNLKTDLAEELAERIAINEGGRKRAVSKQRAMLKQLMAKALRGDVRAADTILRLRERLFEIQAETDARAAISAQDQEIISDFLLRQGVTGEALAAGSARSEADAEPSDTPINSDARHPKRSDSDEHR